MKTVLGHIRRSLLGISAKETTYARRGFRGATEPMRARLDSVGNAFREGYHLALKQSDTARLVERLNRVSLELKGFAFEGASMALALLDGVTPWNRTRIDRFLKGPANEHAYMVHVGVGWLWARWPTRRRLLESHLHPLLRWLAFDGWGFHEGYFHWTKYAAGQPPPKSLSAPECRVFDQGLGRSFWFVNGGNPQLIAQMIGDLPRDRQRELWSGVGLSATYAGLVEESALRALREEAGVHRPQLAQGSAFAAKARQRAGNLTDYTDLAAQVFCEMPARDAAHVCDATLENLPNDATEPAYEIWRRRIRNQFQPRPQLQEA